MKWLIGAALLIAGGYFAFVQLDSMIGRMAWYQIGDNGNFQFKAGGWDVIWYTWPLSLLLSLVVGTAAALGAFVTAKTLIKGDHEQENQSLIARNKELRARAKTAYEEALHNVDRELEEKHSELKSQAEFQSRQQANLDAREQKIREREQRVDDVVADAAKSIADANSETESLRQRSEHALRIMRSAKTKRDHWKAKCGRMSKKLDELEAELESQNNA